MPVSSYLKASVCLIILIFHSTSTRADVTSTCQNTCSGSEGETALAACVSKCMEIISYVKEPDTEDQIPAEEEYEDPTNGLRSEKALQARVYRPLLNGIFHHDNDATDGGLQDFRFRPNRRVVDKKQFGLWVRFGKRADKAAPESGR